MSEGTTFALDIPALFSVICFLGLFYVLLRLSHLFKEPHLKFSNAKALSFKKKCWRSHLAKWPRRLLFLGLFAFLTAFVDPHFYVDRKWDMALQKGALPHHSALPPTEGIAIYLLLDQSGSMAEEVPVYSSADGRKKMTKIALLKQVTKQFISGDKTLGLPGRPNDLIGLITFARKAEVMSPLTLDHQSILDQLNHFHVVKSRDQDGTAIGYAIFKATNLIAATRHYSQDLIQKGEPAYSIKNSVIILITDGLQDPNPLDAGKRLRNIDIPGAADFAKEQHVRLYIINVDPAITKESLAPNRHQMQRAAKLTGGQFFVVTGASGLEDIYKQIDQLEKSKISQALEGQINKEDHPDLYLRISLYPYLIAFGLISLLIGLLGKTTLFRRVP